MSGIHSANESINVVEMVTDNTNAGLLLRCNFIALNCLKDIICFFLEGALQQGNTMLGIKILVGPRSRLEIRHSSYTLLITK